MIERQRIFSLSFSFVYTEKKRLERMNTMNDFLLTYQRLFALSGYSFTQENNLFTLATSEYEFHMKVQQHENELVVHFQDGNDFKMPDIEFLYHVWSGYAYTQNCSELSFWFADKEGSIFSSMTARIGLPYQLNLVFKHPLKPDGTRYGGVAPVSERIVELAYLAIDIHEYIESNPQESFLYKISFQPKHLNFKAESSSVSKLFVCKSGLVSSYENESCSYETKEELFHYFDTVIEKEVKRTRLEAIFESPHRFFDRFFDNLDFPTATCETLFSDLCSFYPAEDIEDDMLTKLKSFHSPTILSMNDHSTLYRLTVLNHDIIWTEGYARKYQIHPVEEQMKEEKKTS